MNMMIVLGGDKKSGVYVYAAKPEIPRLFKLLSISGRYRVKLWLQGDERSYIPVTAETRALGCLRLGRKSIVRLCGKTGMLRNLGLVLAT